MRVMVAMSGGVDSSLAAGLMLEAGHEVVGLTMKLRDTTPEEQSGHGGSCCSPEDLMDARLVCDTLGVPHYVVDYRQVFHETVIEPFAQSYLRGETPNPCVRCNDHVKFATLLERAKALGADALVTGHYARITEEPDGFALRKAVDAHKDQSYFLFGIEQSALALTRFPLGELSKDEVRDKARAMGLPTWDKADSEDICFVPDNNYARVVEEIIEGSGHSVPAPGPIVHEDGRELGLHQGIHRYTVGQRKGLGVSSSERLYVLSVEQDTLRVGPASSLAAGGLEARECTWLVPPVEGLRRCEVRIRYRHKGAAAELLVDGERALVRFDAPQNAVAPGQAAVVYDGDRVLGGGWIRRALSVGEESRA